MKITGVRILPVVLVTGACALLPSRGDPAARLAAGVMIVRDEWGVPHSFGDTDAHTAFGIGYAQAEDDFWQLEETYLHALGRASHWYGEQYLAGDLVRAAFEVERLAREEYHREPPERRAIWDAFAAGINYFIRTAGERPRLITSFEPWMPFALVRAIDARTTIDGVRLDALATEGAAGVPRGIPAADSAHDASMAWALAPRRSAGGHALLLQAAAGEFFGTAQPYEMMLASETGWHVRGFAVLGTPLPYIGHNETLAWGHAASATDGADVYHVVFDHPTDPLMYHFDGGWRRAIEWQDTLLVNSAQGVSPRVFTFRRTHHGPIVDMREGRGLAVRIARMEEGGSLQQWHAMGRARGLAEFRAALDQRALPSFSTVYADTAGNILFLEGSAVPVRDTTFDWSQPVDGGTSRTDWRGYHSVDELRQVLNPVEGWIAAPRAVSRAGLTVPAAAAAHAARARALLDGDSAWTFDAWSGAAFDTHLANVDEAVAGLAAEWEQIGGLDPVRARRLDSIVDMLRSWDHVGHVDSEATTLFVLWREQVRNAQHAGEYPLFRALEAVLARLERDWGSTLVKWGAVNRLQRIPPHGAFSDADPSIPVAGTPAGSLFAFGADVQPGQRARYGVSGLHAVMAVELAPAIRSGSVVVFGQSGDSASGHFFDQAPRYAAGELKKGAFDRDSVMANARRIYRPGGPAVRELP